MTQQLMPHLRFWLLSTLFIGSLLPGFAQQHVLSLHLQNLPGGHISPAYEYVFGDLASFRITAGYTPSRNVPGSRLLRSVILNDPDNSNFGLNGQYTKLVIMPEVRWYFSQKGAPNGFYAALGARYARHRVEVPYQFSVGGEIIESSAQMRMQVLGPTITLGVQWLIADRISLDVFAGGGVGYAPIRLDLIDENLTQDAYEAAFNQLAEELKVDLEPGDLPRFITNRGLQISVPFIMPIARGGIALGFAL